MRRAILATLGAIAAALNLPDAASASATLQISPVLLEVPSGTAVSSVSIANDDSRPAAVQLRLFRWTQAHGEETLAPTDDVVASPPVATIEARSALNVRVIRVSKADVETEESYRLVIDQLPQVDGAGRSVVAILLRQVLPVFFEPEERGSPDVAWSIARTAKGWALRAHNSGSRRLRIARLALGGLTMGGGLLGYALPNSEMSWTLPGRRATFSAGAHVTLRGDSDIGALRAIATVSAE